MTVTVEVINQGSLNLLRDMANLGLIHLHTSAQQETVETARQSTGNDVQEEKPSYLSYLGCCEGIPGGSVDDFLARCYEDKEYELAIEKRQEEERARCAKLHS